MKVPECKLCIYLHFCTYYLFYLLNGPVKKGQWAVLSLFRWQRDLRVRWHLCLIHSPCTQLSFRIGTHTPAKSGPPPHLSVQIWTSLHLRDSLLLPCWGSLPWRRFSLVPLGGKYSAYPGAGPRTQPSLADVDREAARTLLRGLDRSW